jgi:hypothetical protein
MSSMKIAISIRPGAKSSVPGSTRTSNSHTPSGSLALNR